MKKKLNRRSYKKVDTFEVTSGHLAVSDPGYDCPTSKVKCERGTWTAYLNINRYVYTIDGEQYKEQRVATLFATTGDRSIFSGFKVRENNDRWNFFFPVEWEKSDSIPVDSGQVCICDQAAFGDETLFAEDGNCGFGNRWYSNLCDITLSGLAGTFPCGVVASSGFGDGWYPSFIHRGWNGAVDAIAVVFLADNEAIEF